jgi:hypothetical protein
VFGQHDDKLGWCSTQDANNSLTMFIGSRNA